MKLSTEWLIIINHMAGTFHFLSIKSGDLQATLFGKTHQMSRAVLLLRKETEEITRVSCT